MSVLGIDVGSISTKAVLLTDNQQFCIIVPTGHSPRQAGQEACSLLLNQSGYTLKGINYVVGTGYGRVALPMAHKTVTEITCHARGAAALVSGSDLVIDIGGQDSKVIKIDPRGQVTDFLMNDKCAAGTGRFLQVTAAALGLDVSELAKTSRECQPLMINSMCAVFAESEVIGLLAQGQPPGNIVAGLHQAIARRIGTMAQKLHPIHQVTFTGGVARNEGMRQALEKILQIPVLVPSDCQIAGALGAALIAHDLGNTR
ncbi:MAG: acyl-CoA dehydratase activase [Methylocystaceae bacterium]